MTTITARLSNQFADLQQLVLFPEVVGTWYQSLDQCRAAETAPASEQEEASLTFQEALDAGQLPLFT